MMVTRYRTFFSLIGSSLLLTQISVADAQPATRLTVNPTHAPSEWAPVKMKVACVGDSITNGAGTTAPEGSSNSYPSQLQRMLGDKFEVRNFGVGGTTLLKNGDSPYQRQEAFQQAKEFAPDVVVIMLGTNDTKPQNWKYKDDFAADCEDLIKQFAGLPSSPRIYLCRPCFVAGEGNFGINEPCVEAELPLIDAVAQKTGTRIIDVHAATKDDTVHFPDRVHPDNRGAELIAKAVFKGIAGHVYDGPSPIVTP
jgi:acyl-CoA thioesterase I